MKKKPEGKEDRRRRPEKKLSVKKRVEERKRAKGGWKGVKAKVGGQRVR